MTVFIVAGGDLQDDFAKTFITEHSEGDALIIACDKGFDHCQRIGILPNITVGDFDSISKEAFDKITDSKTEVVKLNPIKDDTDAEAALSLAIERTKADVPIYILGAIGSRVDHILGNVGLLGYGLMKDRVVALVDAHNYIQMIGPGETLEIERSGQYKQFGEYISVFPYGGIATGVTMKGFKYPLDRATVTGFNTLTVSNEIVEDVAQISINQGYLIICETRD